MSNTLSSPCDRAVVLSAHGSAPCRQEAKKWVLAATILASSMAFIDGTVVNVVLPALQAQFHATLVDVQWVVEAYALCLAALLLPGGSLGDRFGRRRVFAIGVAVFGAASAACGLAGSVRALILARAVQGIGAALLVPGSLAILSAAFDGRERGRAIGTWSGATAITTALGPILGGWLIDHLSWRWAFFVNVPLAAAVLVMSFARVPESRGAQKGPIDWKGAALATVALGGIVFGLIESSNAGWRSPRVLIGLAAGAVALVLFAVVELRVSHPMVPPRLFRSRNFSGSNLITLFLYAALSGVFFFVPLELIQVEGYSATAAGAASAPVIVLMFLLSRWSGGLVHRLGPRIPLVVGPLVAGTGFALFLRATGGGSYWAVFFPAMAVLGLGLALTVAPLTTTVMSSVGSEHAGTASGINNAVSRAAGLLAVAILSLVMLHVFRPRLEQALAASAVAPATKTAIESQTTRLAAIEPPADAPSRDRTAARAAISGAFVSGFHRVMLIAAALALLASASAFWLISSRRTRA